jgi:hypothetical protein
VSAGGPEAVRVGSVVIDCNDFERMMGFWRDALGYEPRDEPEEDWVVLRDPDDVGVQVSLQRVPEPRIGKNRLHLDLYTADPEGEIERLLALGARRYPRIPEPGEDFVTLEDPEHNLFDVIDARGQAPGAG